MLAERQSMKIITAFLLITSAYLQSAEVSLLVDPIIGHDDSGTYINIFLVNNSEKNIKVQYLPKSFHGDILIGGVYGLKRYGLPKIITMKMTALYKFDELNLSPGEKYKYIIHSRDLVTWEDQKVALADFSDQQSIIIEYHSQNEIGVTLTSNEMRLKNK